MLLNDKYLVDLVSAGLEGNVHKVENIASVLYRSIKKENPELSGQIKQLLSEFSFHGSNFLRRTERPSVPVSQDTQLDLAKLSPPDVTVNQRPVFNGAIDAFINDFIEERKNADKLIAHGINPSNSILLIGMPGTGKTMLANYLASAIDKQLITLDLSATISSLLGKTGANLKKVLDYAKNSAGVLLLDEFDAIAKKRDDTTELGEIKRIVNVLLMEMENWPASSVLIATSNHPELLDRAVWRRFDHVLDIPTPQLPQRSALLQTELGTYVKKERETAVLKLVANYLEGKSAAEICRVSNNIKRRIILKNEEMTSAAIKELCSFADKKNKGRIVILAKELLGNKISVRELAELTSMSSSGVQHHLTK